MADIQSASWSQTDASNNSASPNGFPENMAPSGVDDSMRGVMGAVRRWHDQAGPTISSVGTNTITLTYSVAPAAYVQGDVYYFIPAATNTGAATFNVNSLGAKNIFSNGAALVGGEIRINVPALVAYDGTQFNLLNGYSSDLVGTATNNNAATGRLGEYVSSNVPSGSAVGLGSTGGAFNVTSISLTAGDWDVDGAVAFSNAGTSESQWQAGINLTTAAIPTLSPTIGAGTGPLAELTDNTGTLGNQILHLARGRLSISATTTVYLVASMTYSGTAPTAYGYIQARRVR